MDTPALALVAFAVGTVGSSVKSVPQFVRTAIRGRVAGLSRTAVWIAVAANVLWGSPSATGCSSASASCRRL